MRALIALLLLLSLPVVKLSKNFTLDEFRCKCCGQAPVDSLKKLVAKLQEARDIASVPFIVLSGYRCPEHNKSVGGVANSAHTKGLAADIATENAVLRYRILRSVLLVDFKRVGVYNSFVHVDVDNSKPQTVIWIGGGKDL